jgi:hypothetical protein
MLPSTHALHAFSAGSPVYWPARSQQAMCQSYLLGHLRKLRAFRGALRTCSVPGHDMNVEIGTNCTDDGGL